MEEEGCTERRTDATEFTQYNGVNVDMHNETVVGVQERTVIQTHTVDAR